MLATFIGCSGNPLPDDAQTGAGAGPVAAAGSGGSATTAGQTSTGAGNGTVPPGAGSSSGGASSGGATVGGAGTSAGGANSAGSAGVNGGATTGGSTAGGASHGGSGGGAQVDPNSLPNVTLHLAGDSTVMTYEPSSAQEGWGQELPQFFNSKVSFDNQAIGGASVETFYTGRWKNVMSNLKAGDYVMAAFGANDSGTVEGRHVEPPNFQKRYQVMFQEVTAKQATFIPVTPSALQEWSGGKEGNTRLALYVRAIQLFADQQSLKPADLNARSLELLNQVGQEAAKEIYIGGDKAHFTKKGATQMAELVAHELTRIGSPLGAYVK